MVSTDIEWEKWGAADPYFGVITLSKFRAANLTPQAKQEFFASGRHHVQCILETCRRLIDPTFAPKRVLDFGCGVGRLVVPFAELAEWVVGVDVSPSMLVEARRNCTEFNLHHIDLLASDDELSMLGEPFDLVHSSIVFQHIDVARGRRLFSRLVELLAPGGLGAVHVTYGKAAFAGTFGQSPPQAPAAPERSWTQMLIPRWLERKADEPVEHKPVNGDPEMQMNSYSLSELAFVLQTAGVARFVADFTDHGGELGVILYFQKPA